MDSTTLTQALGIGVPTVGSLATLGYLGWKREKQKRYTQALQTEQQHRAQLLTGASILRPQSDVWRRADGRGQICIAGAGGYFSRQLPHILATFERAGVADFIGGILLIDLDDSEQRISLDSIPPAFASRIVVARCETLPVGLHGCTVQEALGLTHLWGHDVQRAVDQWLSLIQCNFLPAVLVSFISSAGMAALLYPALTAYHERYPQSPIYSTSILDHKTVVRERFPSIRQLYGHNGLIRGTIIADNLRQPGRSDMAIALLFAAMTGASWLGELPLQMWNGMSYVFAKERAVRYGTVSTWAEMTPVHHIPAWHDVLPAIHYTKGAIVEEKILRGIRHLLEHPELQAVPLEAIGRGHTRLLYVIGPIIPEPDFKHIAQRVDANLADWRAQTDSDLIINYASIGSPMNQATTETPLVLVLLQPLATDGRDLDALALGTYQIDPKFFPAPAYPPLTMPALERQLTEVTNEA